MDGAVASPGRIAALVNGAGRQRSERKKKGKTESFLPVFNFKMSLFLS